MILQIMCACLVPVIFIIQDFSGIDLSPLSAQVIYPSDSCIRGRPDLSGPEYLRSKPHVLIHYTIEGEDSTTFSYAESVAVYAETSWVRTERMGWYMAAPDGNNGGDARYDFYIRDPENIGYPGLTWPEDPYDDPFTDGYTAYSEVSNSYTNYGSLSSLVAHEFHHGCQKRYSAWEAMWWYENTSVFMEEIIYDDINTLAYRLATIRPNPVLDPHRKFSEDEGAYEYAGGLWGLFLHEYYGHSSMLMSWNRCGHHGGNHSIEDMDYALSTYCNSDLKTALSHYAIWRYFCGNRDIDDHFEEAWSFPDAQILRTHTSYPSSGDQDTLYPDGPGGCNFIQLANLGVCHAHIFFDGENEHDWSVYIVGINYIPGQPDECYEYKMLLDAVEDTGTITLPCWDYDTLVLIPIVTQWDGSANDMTYSYNISTVTLAHGMDDFDYNRDESQYFRCSTPTALPITFYYGFLPWNRDGLLRIFDIQGQLVNVLKPIPSIGAAIWDGCDLAGNTVSSGIYYCILESGDRRETCKVVLVR
jgi:hypothetical protein